MLVVESCWATVHEWSGPCYDTDMPGTTVVLVKRHISCICVLSNTHARNSLALVIIAWCISVQISNSLRINIHIMLNACCVWQLHPFWWHCGISNSPTRKMYTYTNNIDKASSLCFQHVPGADQPIIYPDASLDNPLPQQYESPPNTTDTVRLGPSEHVPRFAAPPQQNKPIVIEVSYWFTTLHVLWKAQLKGISIKFV